MSAGFQFRALDAGQFTPLFGKTDAELAAIGGRRMEVTEHPGFPCRVSLADAAVGETVVLLTFTHHDAASPYRASGPIFVRQEAETAQPAANEVPAMFRHRQLSIRGYDGEAMMVGAEVVNGTELEAAIQRLFADDRVSYLHVHNAMPGCYNCRVDRAV